MFAFSVLSEVAASVACKAREASRRDECMRDLMQHIRFFVWALEYRADFSGVHHFPQRIEEAVSQLLALDPTNSYANEVKRKLPHFRERAAEIVAARKFVGEPDKNLTR